MKYKYIIYEKNVKEKIATITLNRPEKLNALPIKVSEGKTMTGEMVEALHKAERDNDVKCIILKGEGKSFSTGYDLTNVGFVYGFGDGKTEEAKRRPSQRNRLLFDRSEVVDHLKAFLYSMKPIIAQVHGYCIGGGLYYALASDLTIAAENAKIGHPEQRLGFAGNMFLLNLEMLLIGPKKTRELCLLGELVDGKEAERIGLVNKAVPEDKLEEEVMKYARLICLQPIDGLVMGKAFNQLALEIYGMSAALTQGYIGHSYFTNISFESDEYNFFKERRDRGAKAGFHERDARYSKIK